MFEARNSFLKIIKGFDMLNQNRLFYLSGAIFCLLGAYVAFMTVDKYAVIVHGVLGGTVLYFVYLLFLSNRRIGNRMIDEPPEFPRDFRYFGFGFILTLILFWASVQVLHLIWYIIARF